MLTLELSIHCFRFIITIPEEAISSPSDFEVIAQQMYRREITVFQLILQVIANAITIFVI